MVRPAGVPASAWPADAYAFGRKDSKQREANEGHVRQTTTDIHQSAKLLAPRLSCFHAMRAWRPATTALKRFINLRLKNTSMRVPPVGPPHAAKKVLSKIDTMSMISQRNVFLGSWCLLTAFPNQPGGSMISLSGKNKSPAINDA